MTTAPQPASWRPAPTVIWLPEPHAEAAEAPQTIYLLDLEAEVPMILEETSALIWSALMDRLARPSAAEADTDGQGVSSAHLAVDLTRDGPLRPEEIQQDIEDLLTQLGAAGVLVRAPRGTGLEA